MFGIDGVKMPSNASKEWRGTIAVLKKKKDFGLHPNKFTQLSDFI